MANPSTALPHVIADRPDVQQNFDALLAGGTYYPGDYKLSAQAADHGPWVLCDASVKKRAAPGSSVMTSTCEITPVRKTRSIGPSPMTR